MGGPGGGVDYAAARDALLTLVAVAILFALMLLAAFHAPAASQLQGVFFWTAVAIGLILTVGLAALLAAVL